MNQNQDPFSIDSPGAPDVIASTGNPTPLPRTESDCRRRREEQHPNSYVIPFVPLTLAAELPLFL